MPLEHSASPQAFSRNVKALMGDIGKSPHVKSPQQALAIAYATKARAARANGGVAGYDTGGAVQDVISALQQGAGAGVAPGVSSPSTTPAIGTSAQSTSVAQQPAATAPASSMSQPNPVATPTASPTPTVIPQASGVANPSASTPSLTLPAPVTNQVVAAPAVTAQNGVAPSNVAASPVPHAANGGVPGRAFGGFNMAQGPSLNPSWQERAEARQMRIGPILSAVPGRTDNHRSVVPGGSYILPAQHIASLGHGNTLAGMSIASKMFGGPYGTGVPHLGHGSMPRPPKMQQIMASEGGARGHQFAPVAVDLAGGEYSIPPWVIIQKFGSLKNGHRILDKWVMDTRRREIETQKKLPPPAKK